MAITLACWTAGTTHAAPVQVGPVAAELISEVAAVVPGEPFTVALRLELDSPWHLYWSNPGDSGLPPTLTWNLPENFTAGDLQFPFPTAIATPPFMTYGMEGEVFLLATITPPAQLPLGSVSLKAEADWLICNEYCVPGGAALELILPVAPGPAAPDPAHAARFAAARARLPEAGSGWTFQVQPRRGRLVLHAQPPPGTPLDIPAATFFPYDPEVIRHAAPQTWQRAGAGYALELVPAAPAAELPERLAGVLVAPIPWDAATGRRALHVDLPFTGEPPRPNNPERNTP